MTNDDTSLRDDLLEAMTGSVEIEDEAPAGDVPGVDQIGDPGPAEDEEVEASTEEQVEETTDEEVEVSDEDDLLETIRDAQQAVKAPDHWSATDREFFQGLPSDDVRQQVLDWRTSIEKGAQDKFEAAAAARKLNEEVTALLKPYEAAMQAEGISATDAVKRLFSAEQALRTDPAGTLLSLAQQYGRGVAGTPQARQFVQQMAESLGIGAGALNNAGQADPNDPRVAEIDALQTRLTQFEQRDQQSRQQTAQAALTAAQKQLNTFTSAKDDTGNARYPHFEQVRGHMAVLVQTAQASGESLTLEAAYDRAVWADEGLRAGLIADRQARDASEAARKRKDASDRASRARTRTSRSSAASVDPSSRSLREDLAEAFRAQQA